MQNQENIPYYKEKYDNTAQIREALEKVKKLEHLHNLYTMNAPFIEKLSWLKREFQDKRVQLEHNRSPAIMA